MASFAIFFYSSIKSMMNRNVEITRLMLTQMQEGKEIEPAKLPDIKRKKGRAYTKSKDLDAVMKGEIVEFWQ